MKALGRYNEAIVSLRKGRQVDPKYEKIRDVISEVRLSSCLHLINSILPLLTRASFKTDRLTIYVEEREEKNN